jgi:hypothetical protein
VRRCGLVRVSKAAGVTRVPSMSVSVTWRGRGILSLSRAGYERYGIGSGGGAGCEGGSACVSSSELIKRRNLSRGSSVMWIGNRFRARAQTRRILRTPGRITKADSATSRQVEKKPGGETIRGESTSEQMRRLVVSAYAAERQNLWPGVLTCGTYGNTVRHWRLPWGGT